jgi:hypothetical protein
MERRCVTVLSNSTIPYRSQAQQAQQEMAPRRTHSHASRLAVQMLEHRHMFFVAALQFRIPAKNNNNNNDDDERPS